MKYSRLISAFIGVWVITTPLAQADEKIGATPICGGYSSFPRWKVLDPGPWANDCRMRISHSLSEHENFTPQNGPIICTFVLERNGEINDPFVYSSRNSKDTNRTALQILANSGPFANPPEILLGKQRIAVTFNQGKSFEVSMDSRKFNGMGDRDITFQFYKRERADASK